MGSVNSVVDIVKKEVGELPGLDFYSPFDGDEFFNPTVRKVEGCLERDALVV